MISIEIDKYKKLIDDITGCLQLKVIASNHQIIVNKLKNKMLLEKINNLISGNLPVSYLNQQELYYITNVLYQLINKEGFINSKLNEEQKSLGADLNPKKYFTEEEIKHYENILPILQDSKDFSKMHFEDVLKIEENIYLAVIDLNYVLDFREIGRITYNKDSQRETEKYKWKGRYMERAKIYSKSIHEIAQSMKDKTYIATNIAINIPSNGKENFIVKEKYPNIYNIDIVFDENTLADLTDGQHRTLGGMIARNWCEMEGKPFNQKMGLILMNLSPIRARNYVYQENQKNPINDSLIRAMKQNIENEIAYYMNKGETCLYNLLGREEKDVYTLEKLTSLELFSKGLEYFKIEKDDLVEHDRIKLYLNEYFKYLFSYFKEDMSNIYQSRKLNFKLNPNLFIGYLYIASKLYKVENWKQHLFQILNKIDYSLNGELKKFKIDKQNLSNKNINNMIHYLENIMEQKGE